MKNIFLKVVICGLVSLLSIQCNTMINTPEKFYEKSVVASSQLDVSIQTKGNYTQENPVLIDFTVHNPTKKTLKFTKYHTPFEGFMSTFLIVKNSKGEEVDYIGAMAKRIIPPPYDSYIALDAGESKTISFDLTKGYKIDQEGIYTVQFQGGAVNGLPESQSINIKVTDDLTAQIKQTLIIMLKPEASLSLIIKKSEDFGATVVHQYSSLNGLAIKIPDNISIKEAMQYFEKLEGVESVSPDEISTIQ